MRTTTLLWLTLCITGFIAVAHYLAYEFTLYYQYPWLDVPMHILGGITAAFGFLLLPVFHIELPERYIDLLPVLAFVLVIGLVWELFEIWIGLPLIEGTYEQDLFGDLAMDLVGGALGFYLGRRINRL